MKFFVPIVATLLGAAALSEGFSPDTASLDVRELRRRRRNTRKIYLPHIPSGEPAAEALEVLYDKKADLAAAEAELDTALDAQAELEAATARKAKADGLLTPVKAELDKMLNVVQPKDRELYVKRAETKYARQQIQKTLKSLKKELKAYKKTQKRSARKYRTWARRGALDKLVTNHETGSQCETYVWQYFEKRAVEASFYRKMGRRKYGKFKMVDECPADEFPVADSDA
mmetsp:Transcript_35945/g.57433  ORF Transcript_35945/g.57433 Transcript_35945/m.57433 type:complete len:229 (+) Transcript_35945:142-828(+)